MVRRQLPVGLQDFRTVREQEFYYVDKTSHIQHEKKPVVGEAGGRAPR